MYTPQFRLGFERKIGYSFLGLAAGNLVVLAAVSICEAIGLNSLVPAGPLRERLLRALALAFYFGSVSLVSWAIIGLPVVLALSANLISRLHWSLASLIGSILGAIPFALLFVAMSGGWQQLLATLRNPQVLRVYLLFLAVAVIIGGVAFSVYCLLVRRASRREQRKSGAPSGTPQFFSIF